MADPDGWEVWDDRGSDRKNRDRDSGAHDEEPERKPLGTGWLIGLILGGVLLLGIVGAAFYYLLDDDLDEQQFFANAPNGPGPVLGPGFQAPPIFLDSDLREVDDQTHQDVVKCLMSLGKEITRLDYDPRQHFHVDRFADLAQDAVPLEPNWGQLVHLPQPGVPPVEKANMTRSFLRSKRNTWRQWDWEHAEILIVNDSTSYGLRAVVKFSSPSGPPVRIVWDFSPTANLGPEEGEFPWTISNWEDLNTGISGSSELALQMIQRAERRPDLYSFFWRLNEAHRKLDAQEFHEAADCLTELNQFRPVGIFRALVGLAQVKLLLRQFGHKQAGELLREIMDHYPGLAPLDALQAEAAIKLNTPDQAITICEATLKRFGTDPAVLAILGAALIATGEPDAARPHILKSLKLNPDNVITLEAFCKIRTAQENELYAQVLQATTQFPKMFRSLAWSAKTNQDWIALELLARRYISQRADDQSGHQDLIQALARSGRMNAALEHFYQVAPQYQGYPRNFLIETLTLAIIDLKQSVQVYKSLPEVWKEELFAHLSNLLEMRNHVGRARLIQDKTPFPEELKALQEAHAALYPNSPSLLLCQANELIHLKKWAEAEAKLSAIAPTSAAQRDYLNPIYFPLRFAQVKVWYALKKWDEALTPRPEWENSFPQLARMCAQEKDFNRLESLLAVATQKAVQEQAILYWKGVLLAGRGKHADALVEFRKLLKATPARGIDFEDEYDDEQAFTHQNLYRSFTLSAVKADHADEAVKVLETAEFVSPSLFAFALISAGQDERAVRYLTAQIEDERIQAATLYSDIDLGPLLKQQKKAFLQFRQQFPPQNDRVEED